MKIVQTRKLIEQKEYQIRQNEENSLSQELMKADKWQELSELMHASIDKVNRLKDKQKQEHREYQKRVTKEIKDEDRKLQKEKVRIETDMEL